MVTFSAGEAELTSSFLPLFLSVCNLTNSVHGKASEKDDKEKGGEKEGRNEPKNRAVLRLPAQRFSVLGRGPVTEKREGEIL